MPQHNKMFNLSLPNILTLFFLVLFTSRYGKTCPNAFGKFQEILQTPQIAGRLGGGTKTKISDQFVLTKMECLDVCLRTEECGSFDMKRKSKYWICKTNRRFNAEGTSPTFKQKRENSWIHFNASSQELQEVSYLVTVTLYFYRCLPSNQRNASGFNCRYLNPYIKLQLTELANNLYQEFCIKLTAEFFSSSKCGRPNRLLKVTSKREFVCLPLNLESS